MDTLFDPRTKQDLTDSETVEVIEALEDSYDYVDLNDEIYFENLPDNHE